MYILKVDDLIEDLKQGNVSQREQFKYALAFSILMLLVAEPALSVGFEYSLIDFVSTLSLLVVTVFGLMICFRANERADGKDFILRFFTIGLPVTVRFVAFFVVLVLLLMLIETIMGLNLYIFSDSSITTYYEGVWFFIVESAFYLYFASKFKRFNQGRDS